MIPNCNIAGVKKCFYCRINSSNSPEYFGCDTRYIHGIVKNFLPDRDYIKSALLNIISFYPDTLKTVIDLYFPEHKNLLNTILLLK